MDRPRAGGELALLTFGAILVAGAVQRSGDAAVAGVRANVLHRLGLVRNRWRRPTAAASTSFELVPGTALIAYALFRTARAAMESAPGDSSPTDTSPTDTSPTDTSPTDRPPTATSHDEPAGRGMPTAA